MYKGSNPNKEYYVYALMDSSKPLLPGDKYGLKFEPVYVGKGTGGRDGVHEYNAYQKNYSHNPRLLTKLLDMKSRGSKIVVARVFTSTDEEAVYAYEKSMIIFYGLHHKGGLLLNGGTGKAGGWGNILNPTYKRMESGTHNFQTSNPIFANAKLVSIKKLLIKAIELGKPINVIKSGWLEISGYSTLKAMLIGISRLIQREDLPIKIVGVNLVPK